VSASKSIILSSRLSGKSSAGFSLLEMVVALTILAFSLGALYHATGGATRNVRIDEKYAYSVELARSLLAENGKVPSSGTNVAGETSGGFNWYVTTKPITFGRTSTPDALLHEIEVGVSWVDTGKRREVVLSSVAEGHVQ
jgi:general secretion pathway protein I